MPSAVARAGMPIGVEISTPVWYPPSTRKDPCALRSCSSVRPLPARCWAACGAASAVQIRPGPVGAAKVIVFCHRLRERAHELAFSGDVACAFEFLLEAVGTETSLANTSRDASCSLVWFTTFSRLGSGSERVDPPLHAVASNIRDLQRHARVTRDKTEYGETADERESHEDV